MGKITGMAFNVCICGCICLLGATGAAAAETTARITQLVGKVEVRAKADAAWHAARAGMTVREKWDVRAFIESEAEVTFDNGTKVKIGENSVVTLSRLLSEPGTRASQVTVRVMSGKIWANVRKLTETQSEFEFETPTAVASIRGTRLGIDVGKRLTLIDVFEGTVVVRRKGGTSAVDVTANMRAVIEGDKKDITLIDFKKLGSGKKQGADALPEDPFGAGDTRPEGERPPADSTGTLMSPVNKDTAVADTAGRSSGNGTGNTAEGRSPQRLTLTVTAPAEGTTITEPFIQVTGSTLAGANVFVNDIQAPVGSDGVFSAHLPIPDEPYTYAIEIRAEYGGAEVVRQRNVVYAPGQDKLMLECSSPAEGQVITTRTIRISGKTVKRATVTANGVPVNVAANGIFNGELTVSEQQIGDFLLEVVARNKDEEIAQTYNLEISGASPHINTSAPLCVLSPQGQTGTMQRVMRLQLLDRTPGDELTVKIINNGSTENVASEPGKTEQFLLNEGENVYSIQVVDRAGNCSPVIKGKMYYLPGPLIIMLNEPSSNPMVYEGVPPVLHPGYRSDEQIDVEVEIDDGIGNVPQSIRYCRVTGNGQTIQLRNNNDYIYTGKVSVRRGSNQFTIQVEDMSARLETKRFDVIVR